jgi:hypothetical protein
MTTTPNLLIDHIAAAQAQKEVTANAGFDALDKALCQLTVIALANADLTLADTQLLQSFYLRFTGALTSLRTITVPARAKPFLIENATTGGYALSIKTPSGTSTSVAAGGRKLFYGDGTTLQVLAEAGVGAPYDLGGTFPGQPTSGAVILRFPMPRPVRFQAGFPSSKGVAGTAAAVAVSFTIRKNGTQFATMDFAASATSATFACAADTDFAAGDVLTLVAPSPADTALADIGFALAGLRL